MARLQSLHHWKLASVFDKRFLLLVCYCALAIFHLFSLLRSRQSLEQTSVVTIFYASVIFCYYTGRKPSYFSRHYFPNIIGGLICCLIAFKAVSVFQSEVKVFWAIAAPLMTLGLILFVDGFRGIKHYWRVLFGIAVITAITPGLEEFLRNRDIINSLSAKFASFLLWYVGFESQTESTYIYVNQGIVDVNTGCTAIPFLMVFLNLLIIFRLFYTGLIEKTSFYLVASFVISLLLSIVRIGLLAIVVKDDEVFNYWHGTAGSNFFMSIGLILFLGLVLARESFSETQNNRLQGIATSHQTSDPLFISIAALLVLILLYGILDAQGGANKITKFEFPDKINVMGWQFKNSENLPLEEVDIASASDIIQPKNESLTDEQRLAIREEHNYQDLVLTGKRYVYQRESTPSSKMMLTLRYLVNTIGTIPGLYNDRLPDKTAVKAFLENVEEYRRTTPNIIFFDQTTTYLASCITPSGDGVINNDFFVEKRNENMKKTLLNLPNFINWLQGNVLLLDHRCVWVEIAIEPSTGNARKELDEIWQDLLAYWQQSFPLP